MNDIHPRDAHEASPYGHPHPMLDALAEWVTATDPYTIPAETFTDEDRLTLTNAMRKLNGTIVDAFPYPYQVHGSPAFLTATTRWSMAYQVREHIRNVSVSFLDEAYTDSTTDEPCDVEWNVTGLYKFLDPTYERPDEVRPAYVGFLIDEGHPKDLEES